MKFEIKYSNEMQFIKKLLVTCILIMSIIFIAGCIGEEKTDTETPASYQSTQESATPTTDTLITGSILKQSDVPRLTLDINSGFYAVPKNTLYVYGDVNNRTGYRGTPSIGYREVGEDSTWADQSGRKVRIILSKYDSDPNSKLIKGFTDLEDNFEEEFVARWEPQPNIDQDWGDPHIGEHSLYYTATDQRTDIQTTMIWLLYNNNHLIMEVTDEKGKSKKEAIRIAKIIKSRLN